MKLKDMTENIKTRSAAPLNDDELENVSGGWSYPDEERNYTFMVERPSPVCIVNNRKCFRRQAINFLNQNNGFCPDCGGKLFLKVIGCDMVYCIETIDNMP